MRHSGKGQDMGTAKPIAGAGTSPKCQGNCAKPMDNAVAWRPKSTSVGKIKGAITGPK
jgi:hypothetical protein